jgi:thiol-disulfide isomerase/thioredoxin
MNTKWIVVLGVVGALIAGTGIYYSKKLTSSFGQSDIDKTLSSIDKFKKMQEESVFDFEFTELDSSIKNSSKDNAEPPKYLSDLKGKLILLNFWASWCQPCIQEFPDMIRLIEKRPNMKIVAVNRDVNKEDALKFIESFPEAKGKILFYWDPKGEITSLYGTEVLPESYLIGKDFKALRKIIGIEDWDSPSVLNFIDSL